MIKKVIIGVLVTLIALFFVLPKFYSYDKSHKQYYELRAINYHLLKHYNKCGKYPTTEQGIALLKTKSCSEYSADKNLMIQDFLNNDNEPYIYKSDGVSFTLEVCEDCGFSYNSEESLKMRLNMLEYDKKASGQ